VNEPPEFGGSELFDDLHRSATLRTTPRGKIDGGRFPVGCRIAAEPVPAQWQQLSALACREEAEETDTDKAPRQSVNKEPPEELISGKRHRARSVVALPVAPGEGDLAVGEIHEPVVRDRNTMRVAGEIVKDMLRTAEGTLRVDDPVDVVQRSDEGPESFRVIELFQITVEAQFSPFEGSPQPR